MQASDIETCSDAHLEGARSVFCHGLAVLFQHPDRALVDAVREGKLFSALSRAAESLNQPAALDVLARIEPELARYETSPETLSVEYVRLFGLHGGVNCPPFATEFGKRQAVSKAQDLADINGFYAAFGLALAKDSTDRPDHVSFLFEFLSFLALKQVDAISQHNEEGLIVAADAEKKFFCRYVINWVPVFCESLAAQAQTAYYRELATLTKVFVEAEENRLGVHVERITLSKQEVAPAEEKCMGCIDS